MQNLIASSLFALAILAAPAPGLAQVLEVDDVVAQIATARTGPLVRSMKENGTLALSQASQIPMGMDFATLSLPLQFDGNTHFLTADGMTSLRSIAMALKDRRMEGTRFQVAGHVTSTTNQTQSFQLSARRAAVVVEHLKAFYGIDGARLAPVGYGPNKPIDLANPGNPSNTRIEFINVSDL